MFAMSNVKQTQCKYYPTSVRKLNIFFTPFRCPLRSTFICFSATGPSFRTSNCVYSSAMCPNLTGERVDDGRVNITKDFFNSPTKLTHFLGWFLWLSMQNQIISHKMYEIWSEINDCSLIDVAFLLWSFFIPERTQIMQSSAKLHTLGGVWNPI